MHYYYYYGIAALIARAAHRATSFTSASRVTKSCATRTSEARPSRR